VRARESFQAFRSHWRGRSMNQGGSRLLLCSVRDLHCALPLEHIVETMRPLPVRAMAGTLPFVRGLAVVRGFPIPVVDAALLLCGVTSQASRFVTVKTGAHHVALAVDAVVGVVDLSLDAVAALPPLLQGARLEAISSIGTLDTDLLLVLRATRLVPEEIWATLQVAGASA
jgi:purine-binding chemotaxis protein CheW